MNLPVATSGLLIQCERNFAHECTVQLNHMWTLCNLHSLSRLP